jgi:hypothetical protein
MLMALPLINSCADGMRDGDNRGVRNMRRFGAWIRELSMHVAGREMARVLSFGEAA